MLERKRFWSTRVNASWWSQGWFIQPRGCLIKPFEITAKSKHIPAAAPGHENILSLFSQVKREAQ